jgi:hypothetical protein
MNKHREGVNLRCLRRAIMHLLSTRSSSRSAAAASASSCAGFSSLLAPALILSFEVSTLTATYRGQSSGTTKPLSRDFAVSPKKTTANPPLPRMFFSSNSLVIICSISQKNRKLLADRTLGFQTQHNIIFIMARSPQQTRESFPNYRYNRAIIHRSTR